MSRIGIRAGHTFKSPGSSALLDEITEARKVKEEVIKILKDYVEIVDLQPSEDIPYPQELNEGITRANDNSLDLAFSIHFNNAYDSYSGAIGTECHVYPGSSAKNIAQNIVNNIANLGFKIHGQGVYESPHLGELRCSHCPWIIIEVCFVEATEDVNVYNSLNTSQIANAIVSGIIGHKLETPQLHAELPEGFDPDYYLAHNADVAEAVKNGHFKNAEEHYLLFGYKENRKYKKEPPKYLITKYLPVAYEGYSGVDVDYYIHKYFEGVECYIRGDLKGVWIETAYISDEEQLDRIANNLNNNNLFHAVL